ncbi:hypothetical protein ACFLTP_04210, partial [Chloroflexota bacterium]
NIAGMFERGSEQSFKADRSVIRNAVALFFFDVHKYDATNGWNEESGVAGHYYPTINGMLVTTNLTDLLVAANSSPTPQNYFNNGSNNSIWMGLLVNTPGSADLSNPESHINSSPLNGETGPYLNEIPQSSSINNGNSNGTYTWVVAKDGVVGVVHWDGSKWQVGFSGSYP